VNADELVDLLATEEVDVCVSGPLFIDEMMRARESLRYQGVSLPRWAVASYEISGALCLRCSDIGVDDLIDVTQGFDSVADRLLLLSKGFSVNEGHSPIPARWTVGREFIGLAIRDETDAMIIRRLLVGETNTEISRAVHLSYQTVNNRISQMIHRTGTSNRTQLAMMFHQTGTSSPTLLQVIGASR
jgi:DNA-binding NarL/FixJ family response regulator